MAILTVVVVVCCAFLNHFSWVCVVLVQRNGGIRGFWRRCHAKRDKNAAMPLGCPFSQGKL